MIGPIIYLLLCFVSYKYIITRIIYFCKLYYISFVNDSTFIILTSYVDCMCKIDSFIINLIPNVMHVSVNNLTNIEHLVPFYKLINNSKRKNVDILINMNGSRSIIAHYISKYVLALQKYKTVNAYIPYFAYSGGSYIAMYCTNLFMDKYAQMSPFDLMSKKHNKNISVNTMDTMSDVLSDEEKLGLLELKKIYNWDVELFNEHFKNNLRKDDMFDKFLSGKHPHSAIFNYDDVKSFGVDIKGFVPENIIDVAQFFLH